MGVSTALIATALLFIPAISLAQTAAPVAPRERVTAALTPNFGTNIDTPVFALGVRLSAPLGPRGGIDFEASKEWGQRNPPPHGYIKSSFGLNFRRLRAPRAEDGSSRYWIYGLRYTPIQWPASRRDATYDNDLALTIGHGWDQTFASGLRCGAEIGFSGGNGILFFGTFVVGLPLHR